MKRAKSEDGTEFVKVNNWEELSEALEETEWDENLSIVSFVVERNTEDEGLKDLVLGKVELKDSEKYSILQQKLVGKNPFANHGGRVRKDI